MTGKLKGRDHYTDTEKESGVEVGDYREVTMMSILYKIYAMVLAERLREELEGKQIIPQNQTGFRRGMGTIDNIYVLNYLVNKQIERKGRKMVMLFVDLKAAFDSVDRGVLVREMKARGIREGFIRSVGEVMRETKNRMRIGENLDDSFWTARGLRQVHLVFCYLIS